MAQAEAAEAARENEKKAAVRAEKAKADVLARMAEAGWSCCVLVKALC